MKFKVKIRVTSPTGISRKYSVNLEEGKNFTLGRQTHNGIFDHDSVSVSHCILRIVDGELVILDNRSQRGLRVNNHAASRSPLKPGDLIQMGDFFVEVLEAPPPRAQSFQSTQFIDVSAMESLEGASSEAAAPASAASAAAPASAASAAEPERERERAPEAPRVSEMARVAAEARAAESRATEAARAEANRAAEAARAEAEAPTKIPDPEPVTATPIMDTPAPPVVEATRSTTTNVPFAPSEAAVSTGPAATGTPPGAPYELSEPTPSISSMRPLSPENTPPPPVDEPSLVGLAPPSAQESAPIEEPSGSLGLAQAGLNSAYRPVDEPSLPPFPGRQEQTPVPPFKRPEKTAAAAAAAPAPAPAPAAAKVAPEPFSLLDSLAGSHKLLDAAAADELSALIPKPEPEPPVEEAPSVPQHGYLPPIPETIPELPPMIEQAVLEKPPESVPAPAPARARVASPITPVAPSAPAAPPAVAAPAAAVPAPTIIAARTAPAAALPAAMPPPPAAPAQLPHMPDPPSALIPVPADASAASEVVETESVPPPSGAATGEGEPPVEEFVAHEATLAFDPAQTRRRQLRSWLALSAAVAGIAVLGVGGMHYWRSGSLPIPGVEAPVAKAPEPAAPVAAPAAPATPVNANANAVANAPAQNTMTPPAANPPMNPAAMAQLQQPQQQQQQAQIPGRPAANPHPTAFQLHQPPTATNPQTQIVARGTLTQPPPQAMSAPAAPAPAPAQPTTATVAHAATAQPTNRLPAQDPESVATPVARSSAAPGGREAKDPFALNEFFRAAKSGNLRVLKNVMRENRIDPDTASESGSTALMLAAYSGNLEMVRYLLRLQANVNSRDHTGTTALMWATLKGNKEVVSILLGAGADPNKRRKNGERALDIARQWEYDAIAKILSGVTPGYSSSSTRMPASKSPKKSSRGRSPSSTKPSRSRSKKAPEVYSSTER